jgi:hypothetical protein
MIMFKKLNNFEVLSSFIGTDKRLNKVSYDLNCTRYLTLFQHVSVSLLFSWMSVVNIFENTDGKQNKVALVS